MGEFTVRTRKFLNNPLLGRKQFVLDVIHPGMANVSKKDLAEKLRSMYKVHDVQCIQLFSFKTAFGGGRSSGFGLIYENLEKLKKFEPKYRLKRTGLGGEKKGPGRRAKKDTKNRMKKARGKRRPRPAPRSEPCELLRSHPNGSQNGWIPVKKDAVESSGLSLAH